jgi:hypothetical protein
MSGNLIDILQRLSASHVDFVIIGGFAAVVHGSTLVTQDIDICCEFSETNLKKLQKAIEDIHPVHRLTPKRIPLQITSGSCKDLNNLYLDTDIGTLDCLSSVLGIGDFKKVRKCSVTIKGMNNQTFRVLSLDALILAKKAMDRPKDKETVIQLQAILDQKA